MSGHEPKGPNKLDWKCDRDGCFNIERRPKLEEFYHCFPGSIGFGDVDGVVEINGNFLYLEWKSRGRNIKTGQRILFEQRTRSDPNSRVVVVSGNAKDMSVREFKEYRGGKCGTWQECDLAQLKERFRRWADYAKHHPKSTK